MNTVWILLVWVMLADGERLEFVLDQFESEEACIEQLMEVDLPDSWFAACKPEH